MTHFYKGMWAVTGDWMSLTAHVNPWSVDPKTIEIEWLGSTEGAEYISPWNGSNTGPHVFFSKYSVCVWMTLPRVRTVDRESILYNDNEPTRVQLKPANVMTKRAFSRRKQHRANARYWKSVGRKKGLGDAWISFHLKDDSNLAW